MADIKLNARAARIKTAAAALYGQWGGQTKMAASIGISKQMLSFIINGNRPVTDKVEKAVADALLREADRLRITAVGRNCRKDPAEHREVRWQP